MVDNYQVVGCRCPKPVGNQTWQPFTWFCGEIRIFFDSLDLYEHNLAQIFRSEDTYLLEFRGSRPWGHPNPFQNTQNIDRCVPNTSQSSIRHVPLLVCPWCAILCWFSVCFDKKLSKKLYFSLFYENPSKKSRKFFRNPGKKFRKKLRNFSTSSFLRVINARESEFHT